MTTIPRRVVIDLEFGGTDGQVADVMEAIFVALTASIDGQWSDDDDADAVTIEAVHLAVIDPREEGMRVVITGNPVDGIQLWGPSDDIDADVADALSHGDDWWVAGVQPILNPLWEPLQP